ncbi:unnamed protein product [Gongylonema pulchrum]|uniref:Cnd1 domain-containing protein n=1 Tax=Gongylonema pulchrum TaxID=637853 RepID=A0A183E168_9BILA|nr:unnamed protein product [Gongylonema pulchrum]
MLLQDSATPRLFGLIVSTVNEFHRAYFEDARAHCCQLIGLIFKSIERTEAKYEAMGPQDEASLPAEAKSVLMNILEERRFDKSAVVRVEVVRALSVFCQMSDLMRYDAKFEPNSYIISALRDVSLSVRKEAARCTRLISKVEIAAFVSAIVEEQDSDFRYIAYNRVINDLHVRSLTVEQRTLLLKIAFDESGGRF